MKSMQTKNCTKNIRNENKKIHKKQSKNFQITTNHEMYLK